MPDLPPQIEVRRGPDPVSVQGRLLEVENRLPLIISASVGVAPDGSGALSPLVAEKAAAIDLVEGSIGPAKYLIGQLCDSLCYARQSPRTARVHFRPAIDEYLTHAVVGFAQNREVLGVSLQYHEQMERRSVAERPRYGRLTGKNRTVEPGRFLTA